LKTWPIATLAFPAAGCWHLAVGNFFLGLDVVAIPATLAAGFTRAQLAFMGLLAGAVSGMLA